VPTPFRAWQWNTFVPPQHIGVSIESVSYSEPLARRLIEKITVYDEKLVVEFKSGLTVEVEA
jgi:hypothetical protein